MERSVTSCGVSGEVKGWWVDVSCCWLGEESGEGVVAIGVKRGKWVIQSGEKSVRGGRSEVATAALWRASLRFPRGVEPPEWGMSGRACMMSRSAGSRGKVDVRDVAASKPKEEKPCSGCLGSKAKTPGAPEGLDRNGDPSGESRKVVINLRVRAGSESKIWPDGKTIISMIGSGREVRLRIRSLGRRCSIRWMGMPGWGSGLSEPYLDIASSYAILGNEAGKSTSITSFHSLRIRFSTHSITSAPVLNDISKSS